MSNELPPRSPSVSEEPSLRPPPEASPVAERWVRRLVAPIEAFLHIEASSGVVLIVTAVLALAIANSPFAHLLLDLRALPVGLHFGPFAVEESLSFWINDGLMTIFFFVVGLEIRREIHEGELSQLTRAALPIGAALGGMIAPALLYLAIAGGDESRRSGWGVPMATDIAFAVGVLALLGKRVPPALRVLLLALAIIDDIGSIVVIAVFYSAALHPIGFVVAGAGIAAILALQRVGARAPMLYLVPGFVVWIGALVSGIHPTIAGVIVGLLTPARAWLGPAEVATIARRSASVVEHELTTGDIGHVATPIFVAETALIDLASREAHAPATRLQRVLHPWVAFGIMPLFALANAGVSIQGDAARFSPLTAGIVVGLVVGKPLGIIGACLLATRVGVASLPRGVGGRELVVLGVVAGIGFTMALFVAALAFPSGERLEQAKLAVLVASACAMALGLVAGRLLLRPIRTLDRSSDAPAMARSEAEAEASTEL